MKKLINYLVVCVSLMMPLIVFATNANSGVCKYNSGSDCSNYQDKSINAKGTVYFSHQMITYCKDNRYHNPTYMNPDYKVTCANGNTNPQTSLISSGCPNVGNMCNSYKYCSVVIKYDCDKTSSGAKYFTTTTTKKTTVKRTTTSTTTTTTSTTTTTTEVVKSNTKLETLNVSVGSIKFDSNVYEYTLKIDSNINSVNITAVPEDETSKVEIKDNTNLENGSVIKVVVTGADNSFSTYQIKIEKEMYIMSNNAKLKLLSIDGYGISFNSKINEYPIIIDRDVSKLSINYELEDEKSSVEVIGNENLNNGSKVILKVTAEDGTENKYIINITVKKKSNFIKVLFIIILILAILAGAYYVYKKFVLSKKGEKYEYE